MTAPDTGATPSSHPPPFPRPPSVPPCARNPQSSCGPESAREPGPAGPAAASPSSQSGSPPRASRGLGAAIAFLSALAFLGGFAPGAARAQITNNPPVFSDAGTSVSRDEHPRLPAYLAVVTATDPDPGDTVTYSLGGVDAQRFFLGSLTPGRQFLLFRDSPDFENPDDENGDNVYVVTVTATDGTDSVSKTYTVTVRDVDEPPGRPGAPTFGLPAETSIEVHWSAVENTGPPVTYDLRYRAGT